MQAYSLYKKHSSTPFKYFVGDFINEGADGDIYDLSADQVIKFSVLYKYESHIYEIYKSIRSNLDSILYNSPIAYVKLFEHDFLCKGERSTCNGDQNFIIYYQIMRKLIPLSFKEKNILSILLGNNYISTEKITKEIFSLRKKYNIDFLTTKKIIKFMDNYYHSEMVQDDIHVMNIMKDQEQNFYFIDLDRVRRKTNG